MSESNGRPQGLPRCDHGNAAIDSCPQCRKRYKEIRKLIKPLADEFWEYRGGRDVEDLLHRAYRMGMRHTGA